MTRVLAVSPDAQRRQRLHEWLNEGALEPVIVEQADRPEAEAGETCDVVVLDGDLEALRRGISTGRPAGTIVLLLPQGGRAVEREAVQTGAADAVGWEDATPALLARAVRYAAARRDADRRLANAALFDPETGLARQPLFWEVLSLAVKRARRNEDHLAVLYIHLDGLLNGNGHGSRQLRAGMARSAANRLTGLLRASDTVARFDASQLVVLVESMPRIGDIQTVAEKIIEILGAPLEFDGQTLTLSPSVGISMYPSGAFSAEGLLSDAVGAMTVARESGGEAFKFA